MTMTAETLHPDRITGRERLRFLDLMRTYYENVDKTQFEKDLSEKKSVIVLKKEGDICGFSTQVHEMHSVDGRRVNVLFSGDTIIHEKHRNSMALPVALGKLMLSLRHDSPDIPLYWLLTSKGYKTYRYLPIFFKDYFPMQGRGLSSFEKKVIQAIAAFRFDGRLDMNRWILVADDACQRLRRGVADITEGRRGIPEIAYFEKMNPGHKAGDELICLARFHEDNLNPFLLKRIQG